MDLIGWEIITYLGKMREREVKEVRQLEKRELEGGKDAAPSSTDYCLLSELEEQIRADEMLLLVSLYFFLFMSPGFVFHLSHAAT